MHEIVAIEADESELALRMHHGPREALKVRELTRAHAMHTQRTPWPPIGYTSGQRACAP